MDIYEKVNKIESREDLVDFLEELLLYLEKTAQNGRMIPWSVIWMECGDGYKT